MSYILVATDFSEVSENAAHYAIALAIQSKATVTILHSFIIPVTFSDVPMPVMPIDEGMKMAEERMSELMNTLQKKYTDVSITSKIMFGEIVDCIEEYTEKKNPLMTIVGNSSIEDASLWLGSNTLDALRNLHHAVMTIPPGVVYKTPEKICLACDFKDVTEQLQIGELIKIVRQTGAQLHVLNIDHHNKNVTTDTSLESTTLHYLLQDVNPVYHYVEKENTEEGIEEFMETNHMDWLVIVPHQHSFFESLFHKSHTKAIMKMMHVPLMAIHERKL